MRCALTGGHPISPDVIKFFQAVGLNLKQCYGLTEAGGIFQVQPDDEIKVETVGKTLPGFQVRLSEEQEVLVKSDTLIAGYHNDYRATEAAFQDGWLKTGDAGYLDDDGHLIIIGRKEDIIRDKMGHAFSPDFVETRIKFSPYIKEAVVFGEGRPYITASSISTWKTWATGPKNVLSPSPPIWICPNSPPWRISFAEKSKPSTSNCPKS